MTRPGISQGIVILVAMVIALLAAGAVYLGVSSQSQHAAGKINDTSTAQQQVEDEKDGLKDYLNQTLDNNTGG